MEQRVVSPWERILALSQVLERHILIGMMLQMLHMFQFLGNRVEGNANQRRNHQEHVDVEPVLDRSYIDDVSEMLVEGMV